MRVSWILSCWCTLTLIQVLAIIYDYLLFMGVSCLHQTDSQTFSTITKYLALNNCKLSFRALIGSIQPFKASLTFSTRSFPDKQLRQILIFTRRTRDDGNRHFFVGGKIVVFFFHGTFHGRGVPLRFGKRVENRTWQRGYFFTLLIFQRLVWHSVSPNFEKPRLWRFNFITRATSNHLKN